MQNNTWRRNWENKLIHVFQSSGTSSLDYGYVGVNISFVPAPGGYAYRITARTGWGTAPFVRKDVPHTETKTWDETQERWREETSKYGLISPSSRRLILITVSDSLTSSRILKSAPA